MGWTPGGCRGVCSWAAAGLGRDREDMSGVWWSPLPTAARSPVLGGTQALLCLLLRLGLTGPVSPVLGGCNFPAKMF